MRRAACHPVALDGCCERPPAADRRHDLRGPAPRDRPPAPGERAAPARDGAGHALRARARALGARSRSCCRRCDRARARAARAAGRRLPLRRAGPRPGRVRRRAAPGARPDRARPRRVRARRSRARPTPPACRSSASAAAPRRSTWPAAAGCIQHLPDVTDGTIDHRDRAGLGSRTTSRSSRARGSRRCWAPRRVGELLPPPGRRPARRRPAASRGRPTVRSRAIEGADERLRARRAVARRDARRGRAHAGAAVRARSSTRRARRRRAGR